MHFTDKYVRLLMNSQGNFSLFSNITQLQQENRSKIIWKIFYGLSVSTMVFSLYLFLCMVIFLARKNYEQLEEHNESHSKWYIDVNDYSNDQLRDCKTGKQQNQEAANTLKRGLTPREKTTARAKAAMHYVLLIAIGINLLRGMVEQLIFFVGGSSDYICRILTALGIGLVSFGIHFAGLFLWLRQYNFYANPLMERLSPKGLKYISVATYVEMVVALIICLSIHLWWRDYTATDGICRPQIGSAKIPPYAAFGIVAVTTVANQVLVTFLFLYPLVARKKQMKQLNSKPKKTSRSTARLLHCIKRALRGATIGITTDFIGSIASITLPEDMPLYALSVIFELNITLNICCLFYTYAYWQEIVFPWKIKNHTQK